MSSAIYIVWLSLSCFALCAVTRYASAQTETSIAKQLDWQIDQSALCGGYYLTPQPSLSSPLTNKITLTSNNYDIVATGVSVLSGNVVIDYSCNRLLANQVYLYSNSTTGKPSKLLVDDLKLRQAGLLIIAKHAELNLLTQDGDFDNILYRTTLSNTAFSQGIKHVKLSTDGLCPPNNNNSIDNKNKDVLHAWGEATKYHQQHDNINTLINASYSTCPPIHPAWHLKANKITLDHNNGRGSAVNAKLFIKQVPVLYLPYISFPLDDRRSSGLLWPIMNSINNGSGYIDNYFGIPIYLNLAPNYDDTITPTYYQHRGVYVHNLLRYLSKNSNGQLHLGVLPGDKYFSLFQEKMWRNYMYNTSEYRQAALNKLMHNNSNRLSIDWEHVTHFTQELSTNINYHYVGDDYFTTDFPKQLTYNESNQLLQQAEVRYKNQYWNAIARLQGYQTLHPVDNDTIFLNQYMRIPQILINGDYYTQYGTHYLLQLEATHFDINPTPGDTTIYPTGNRINIQPGLAQTWGTSFFTVKPRAQLSNTIYNLNYAREHNITRTIPILELDSNIYLDKDLNFGHKVYRQTIEPRAYYLYIPYHQQDNLPIFDTTVTPLSYPQLFSYNSFNGIDRLNSANQLSFGISTHILQQDDGRELFNAAIGRAFYLHPNLVKIATNSTDDSNLSNNYNITGLSPIVTEVNFNINESWLGSANLIWDHHRNMFANTNIGLQYTNNEAKLMRLNYSYIADQATGVYSDRSSNTKANVLNLTNITVKWPITNTLGIVGLWSEDWHSVHLQNLLYGLQYDSCCWSAKIIAGKILNKIQDNKPQYSKQLSLQIILKGLGNVNIRNSPVDL